MIGFQPIVYHHNIRVPKIKGFYVDSFDGLMT